MQRYFRFARQKLAVWIRFAGNLIKIDRIESVEKAPIMLVCRDVDRGFLFEGQSYSTLLDSLAEKLSFAGINSVTVLMPFSKGSVSNFGRIIHFNGAFARAKLLDKLIGIINTSNKECINARVKAWAFILDCIKPRVIIGIQPPVELCIAAKDRKIWIADLQHGALSNEGYYGMQHRVPSGQKGWPSSILCWSKDGENWIINKIGIFVSPIVIGNPWIARFVVQSNNDQLVKYYKNELVPKIANRLVILITLQWAFERSGTHHETGLPVGLMNFVKENGKPYDWWIRVHPVTLKSSIFNETISSLNAAFSESENVSWINCSRLPLPVVLSQVDLHFTYESAATIEASCFGVNTALLSKNKELLSEWFFGELNSGSAEFVEDNENEIFEWINKKIRPGKNKIKQVVDVEPLNKFVDDLARYVNDDSKGVTLNAWNSNHVGG